MGITERIRFPPAWAALAALALPLAPPPASAAEHQRDPSEQIVLPPQLLEHVDAAYPADSLPSGADGTVVLFVTVGADGAIEEIAIAQSAGKAFDRAAVEAMKSWKFAPARRGNQPVKARIRVPFHFAPPPDLSHSARPGAPATPPPRTGPPVETLEAPGVAGGVSHTHRDLHEADRAAARRRLEPLHPPADTRAGLSEVTVVGRARSPQRGGSDFRLDVGILKVVPRRSAQELLNLAPGIMLTNRHGEGHAEQVFLRGFDAREGQDLEFSAGGVPINDVGNPHGQGYADTHFIIPELVDSLRVVEGPFDPHQGNFAVAGSADYELGLRDRGLTAKYTAGSFGTQRLLLLWGPRRESVRTFGGAELYRTDGFGQNRYAQRATAMAQYEGALGARGSWRLAGTAYATHFNSAGVLRAADVASGRVGFYDTYDPTQGGDAARYSLAADLESRQGATTYAQQLFLVERSMRLRENFTGFLLDDQKLYQTPHPQRGDLIDSSMQAHVLGGRGSARTHVELGGLEQQLELGYLARFDKVGAVQKRDRFGTTIPYLTESDLESLATNVGLYGDANLRPSSWITLRGGLRADLFAYDVLNRCAVRDGVRGATVDAECQSVDRVGHRGPDQRASTSSALVQPRAALLLGPFDGFLFSGSYGHGARSIDPVYVTHDEKSPFAQVRAYEGGVMAQRTLGDLDLSARSIFYQTHVDRDLIFSETAGRATLASGTTRTGWLGAARARTRVFDQSLNLTLVKARFDDTGLLVPYAPDVVLRSDTAVGSELAVRPAGHAMRAEAGLGASYVGRRPLPYGERSDTIFTLDASANVSWWGWQLGVQATNLLDARIKAAEYNYVSSFANGAYPTLVAARHFVAGPPRALFLSIAATIDELGR